MAERTNDEPDLPADVVADVEEYARGVVHGGFTALDDAVEAVAEYLKGEKHPLAPMAARAIVERLWRERSAEQEGWPRTTDADRLLGVFDALDRDGIVARADFTCCQTCGHAEIGDEAGDGARGYVFFHRQDTESAVADDEVWLAYGSLGVDSDHATADEAVGREVVAALTAGGLPVEWDGSVRTRIKVGPIAWQKRLPVT